MLERVMDHPLLDAAVGFGIREFRKHEEDR